jgi:hypothetical protein
VPDQNLIIRASQNGRTGTVLLSWTLLLGGVTFVIASPGFLSAYPAAATVLLGGLILLALGSSVEMYGVKHLGHGSLILSTNGILLKNIWKKDRFFEWEEIDHFDLRLHDGHDHKSNLQAGFYLKNSVEGRDRFVKFSLDLELNPTQLIEKLQDFKDQNSHD